MMNKNGPLMNRYAVIGNPINHSLSPYIHRAFAKMTGKRLIYHRLLASNDQFEDILRYFFSNNGKGINVTAPFKMDAFKIADKLSSRAAACGSVNTLCKEDNGLLYGENTDGVGLIRDLKNNIKFPLDGKVVLLIGAGGASRSVVFSLLEHPIASLTIVNRNAERAHSLHRYIVETLSSPRDLLCSGGFELAVSRPYDIVINATSSSFFGLSPCDFRIVPGGLAYDMAYGVRSNPFIRIAIEQAAIVTDGLGMLVEQAAESFFLWHGILPIGHSVLAALRGRECKEEY